MDAALRQGVTVSRVIASIARERATEMIASALQALSSGADLVELRLDALIQEEMGELLAQAKFLPDGRWIATCRSRREGGASELDAAAKGELLGMAAAAGAGFVDLEFAAGPESAARNIVAGSATIIVSHHDLAGVPQTANELFANMDSALSSGSVLSSSRLVLKLAWRCASVTENFLAFELMRAAPGRRMAIAMGERGLMSRVLAAKFGAFGTFCAPSADAATAPGQVTVADMLELYGWRKQTSATRVLGVLGCPVAHSLSPAIFNAQFDAADFDGVYLPILIGSEAELRAFLDGCLARPWMDVLGFSVTVPHKRAALDWVGDGAEPLARRIGAVNTLHFTESGVRGFNTDYAGALAAITTGLRIANSDLAKLPVAVLGAGGVARAVVAGLRDRGASVTIYNRTGKTASDLASEFDCHSADWDVRHRHDAKLIVNCTSLGMHPAVDATPMPQEGLREDVAVFDTVYNPRETLMLKQACEVGAPIVDGVAMFVQQAAAQYRIWTGDEADVSRFERMVTDRLAKSRQTEDDRRE